MFTKEQLLEILKKHEIANVRLDKIESKQIEDPVELAHVRGFELGYAGGFKKGWRLSVETLKETLGIDDDNL